MYNAFRRVDINKNGYIEKAELYSATRRMMAMLCKDPYF